MRKILLTAVLAWCTGAACGQNIPENDLQRRAWYVPDAAVAQFAGNMGMLSAGPGFDLFRRKVSIDLLYGFVPKFEGETTQHLISAKFAYRPFHIPMSDRFSLTPLQAGFAVSYYFGDQYTITWEGYPKKYYGFSTRLRLLAFAGPALNYHFDRGQPIQQLSLYSELGTSDFGFISWVRDRQFSAWKVINISLGLRARF